MITTVEVKLLKHLKSVEKINNVDFSEITINMIKKYSVRWEWSKRTEAYDEYRSKIIGDLNNCIVLETLNRSGMLELKSINMLRALTDIAEELNFVLIKKVFEQLKPENAKNLTLDDIEELIKLLKMFQGFILENIKNINLIHGTITKHTSSESITKDVEEGRFIELLRDPVEWQKLVEENDEYYIRYAKELIERRD